MYHSTVLLVDSYLDFYRQEGRRGWKKKEENTHCSWGAPIGDDLMRRKTTTLLELIVAFAIVGLAEVIIAYGVLHDHKILGLVGLGMIFLAMMIIREFRKSLRHENDKRVYEHWSRFTNRSLLSNLLFSMSLKA